MSAPQLDPLAALAATEPRDDWRHKGCPIVRLSATLDPERAETLLRLIDKTEHSAPRISRACTEAGFELTAQAILAHRGRKGACKCPA